MIPPRTPPPAIAEKYGVPVFATLDQALAGAEAFSVVTPTRTHFELADRLLAAGKHVLVEKPMTDNAAQAAQLVRRAAEKNVVLQVGHVERFNPVLHYLEEVATDPRFIESHRLSPYPARSTDIGVVLDLMIHDLDVVLALVRSPVASVDAVGIPVLSKTEDIANARLRFANGCVANLTASRVSPERMRKIRVFSAGALTSYVSLDYRAQEGFILPRGPRRRGGVVLFEKTSARQGLRHRQRICRQKNRARTGAHRKRRAAQAGTAGFHPLHSIASDPESQRRQPPSAPWIWPWKSPARFSTGNARA